MSTTIKHKKVKATKQRSSVFQGPNPVISVTMWGVKHMMNELEAVPYQAVIMKEDFKACSKVSIHNHLFNSMALPSKFTVKEYCPLVFRDVRERLGIDSNDFVESWCGGPAAEAKSAGKSNSTFFTSHDKRYIMKSLNKEEIDLFHKIFPQYHAYMVERQGNSLLPHYLALFRTTVNDKDSYLIVMRNVHSSDVAMNRTYDLKGSRVDRDASEKELAKEHPVMKDNDFVRTGEKLRMGTEVKALFLDKLKLDVEFLTKLKLMDYSLLVGVHKYDEGTVPTEPIDPKRNPYAVGTPNENGEQLFVGIIDILTKYGAKKMAAHNAKMIKHGTKAEISTVNPEQYCIRFLKFIMDNTD